MKQRDYFFRDKIQAAISTAQRDYLNTEEFAFLSLTGKVELTFRDKIAFYLHKDLSTEYIIAREWKSTSSKRIDLAILSKNGLPRVLIEFKAAFDVNYVTGREFKNSMKSDLVKCVNANKDSEMYFIVIANLFQKKIHSQNPALKKFYIDKVNKQVNFSSIKTTVLNNWQSFLKDCGLEKEFWPLNSNGNKYLRNQVDYLVLVNGPYFENQVKRFN